MNTPQTIRVKPAPGLTVRDPITRKPLPAEGDDVQNSSFWRRRIAEGSVVEVASAGKARRSKSPTPQE